MCKKTASIFLALLMLLPLASCASGSAAETTADTTAPVVQDTTAPANAETTEPVDPADFDELPDLNFENTEFGIYTRAKEFFHGEMVVEEATGENLNDAIFDRQTAIEERLGIVINEVTGDTTDAAKSAIQAGDDSYKIVNARNVHTVQYAASHLGYTWDKVKYIDLSKNYWYDTINRNLTLNNVTFTAAGAYNLTSFDYTHVIMFNKQLTDDLHLEDPYQLVRDGKWTFDKFTEFALTAAQDMDGNGVMGLEDRFGYVSGAKQIPPDFWIAAGQLGMTKNEQDIPVYDMPDNEPFVNLVLDLYKMFFDEGFWYVEPDGDNIPPTSIDLFSANQALMMDSTFYYIQGFREMEADFGILPFPKYNEDQKDYLSRIEGCELPLIPACLAQEQADMAGAFLEAMSSYSLTNTVPVYYEVYLKTKISRDNESAEMLDIVFDNRVFDLSDTVWCDSIRDAFIRTLFEANNRNFVSYAKKSANTIQKNIDNIIKGFRD